MTEETHKNSEIRNYLLGNITIEEEREKIEKRLLLDDDFIEEYSIEESELVQDYADGPLSEAEQENFERNYLVSEERWKKVKFARAFRQYVDEQIIENETAESEIKKEDVVSAFTSLAKNYFSSQLQKYHIFFRFHQVKTIY